MRRVLLTCLSLLLGGAGASAQPVTLTAIDGELALTGELRRFDGRFYQIETEFGLVTVAGDRVLCTGTACPGDNETTGFALTVDAHLARVLVPALVEAFAAQQGLPSTRRLTGLEKLVFDLGRSGGTRRFPVSIRITDSDEAFADLAVGEADMILTTRHPTRAERTIAADAGQIINPDGLSNQLEGGVVQAASWTLKEGVRFDAESITSVDWETYPIFTFADAPTVETVLLETPGDPSLGAGEATHGPTAAAIANAIFDATGARLRQVPFTPKRVLAALSN